MTTVVPVAAPILKWAGGKTRLLRQLTALLPDERRAYYEPFFGGGALFFALAPERAVISDINHKLVYTYKAVRDDVDGVIAELAKLSTRVDSESFYAIRERYNRTKMASAQHAAAFIYLNRTCFNGLHRVNKRGEFNVPFGRYTEPRILDELALREASRLLKRARLSVGGFEHVLDRAGAGDFVYFDPPYAPVSSTANFTGYAREGFGREEQARLRDVFVQLDRRGCHVMLSNNDVPEVRDLYVGFRVDAVRASRAIAAKSGSRGAVQELVVRNYETALERKCVSQMELAL